MDMLKGEQESGWTGWGWMVSIILGFTARFCNRWWRADLWCLMVLHLAIWFMMALSGW